MFRALCALHQEVKIVYTACGVITPAGGRLLHKLREDSSFSSSSSSPPPLNLN